MQVSIMLEQVTQTNKEHSPVQVSQYIVIHLSSTQFQYIIITTMYINLSFKIMYLRFKTIKMIQ